MSPRVPATPSGLSHKEFGHRLWGSGTEDAHQRNQSMTRMELERLGLTAELAKAWQEFYAECVREGRGSETAEARRDLLEHCLELLQAS